MSSLDVQQHPVDISSIQAWAAQNLPHVSGRAPGLAMDTLGKAGERGTPGVSKSQAESLSNPPKPGQVFIAAPEEPVFNQLLQVIPSDLVSNLYNHYKELPPNQQQAVAASMQQFLTGDGRKDLPSFLEAVPNEAKDEATEHTERFAGFINKAYADLLMVIQRLFQQSASLMEQTAATGASAVAAASQQTISAGEAQKDIYQQQAKQAELSGKGQMAMGIFSLVGGFLMTIGAGFQMMSALNSAGDAAGAAGDLGKVKIEEDAAPPGGDEEGGGVPEEEGIELTSMGGGAGATGGVGSAAGAGEEAAAGADQTANAMTKEAGTLEKAAGEVGGAPPADKPPANAPPGRGIRGDLSNWAKNRASNPAKVSAIYGLTSSLSQMLAGAGQITQGAMTTATAPLYTRMGADALKQALDQASGMIMQAASDSCKDATNTFTSALQQFIQLMQSAIASYAASVRG